MTKSELLTLDAIREDRWNAVKLGIPADADRKLLRVALEAAHRCVHEAHDKMTAVREGELIPNWWLEAPEPKPDAHEQFEDEWLGALYRYEDLQKRLGIGFTRCRYDRYRILEWVDQQVGGSAGKR
jgi:hypothetical protein